MDYLYESFYKLLKYFHSWLWARSGHGQTRSARGRYIEFTILPNAEISGNQIMGILFDKLHLALVNYGQKDVGVSFPDANIETQKTGLRLRLHGKQTSLTALMTSGWANRFHDYALLSDILPVPEKVAFRTVFRVQEKNSNPERQRRRAIKRHGISEEEAKKQIPDQLQKCLRLPFIEMKSHSTAQQFRLFFNYGELGETCREGEFSTYGFSRTTTIPWF